MAQLPTFTWKFQAALSLARECCCLVAHSCPTLCNPMDCSLPGSSVRGIFQARILEWVAISFSRGSSQPRNPNCHLLHWLADSLALNHLGSPARKYWKENRKLIPSSTVLEILFSFPSSPAIDIYSFLTTFWKNFFLMWTIFTVFIDFVIILLVFCVLAFWPQGKWDLSFPDQGSNPQPLPWKVKS